MRCLTASIRRLSLLCAVPSYFREMYPCNLRSCIERHALHGLFCQIHARAGADICQSVPLIHSKLANSNGNVEAIVALGVDVAFSKVVLHFLVRFLTVFDLLYQPSPGFCKIAYAA